MMKTGIQLSVHQRLEALSAENKPIRIGVSGAGWLGSGLVNQTAHIPGMQVCVLADENPQRAEEVFRSIGVSSDRIIYTDHPGQAADHIHNGGVIVTPDYTLAARTGPIDIITDVSPSPAIGAITANAAIQNGKDVVMVNIEADVTVGRILKRKAHEAGVLYSVSSGDEPGCLMELWDLVKSIGLEPIVIGKGKNNPLDPSANPDTVAESARRSEKDPFQVASYVDGTKTMFEMTCAANATGCTPMRRGMNGPAADLESVSRIFALVEDGGITPTPNTVDFVQGPAMAGGVFITVRVLDERIQDDLTYLKVGSGKYFTFFRPFHLWFIEAPYSIARAFFDRHVWLAPIDEPVAEVITVAKKDLKKGDRLDAFGGYTFYGTMELADVSSSLNALPVGLAPGALMAKNVKAGEIITWGDVKLNEAEVVVQLRREQDEK